MDLPTLWRALSLAPAKRLGLACWPPQRLARPADLVLFDPDAPFIMDRFKLHSKSKNTPFDGARMQGKVHRNLRGGPTRCLRENRCQSIETSVLTALLIWAVLGYLFGSIPFGILISRMMGLGNLRDIGSGNIGATNVLRTGSKPAALATLILDGAKGAVAALIARAMAGEDAAQARRPDGAHRTLLSDLAEVPTAAKGWRRSSVSCSPSACPSAQQVLRDVARGHRRTRNASHPSRRLQRQARPPSG